jgi:hypothetical protein
VLGGREFEVVGEPEDYSHSPFGAPIAMPTPFEVGVRRHSADTSEDEYGNPVESWGLPEPLRVCGWSSPASGGRYGAEPKLAGHDRVVVDGELLIPGYVVNLRRVEG